MRETAFLDSFGDEGSQRFGESIHYLSTSLYEYALDGQSAVQIRPAFNPSALAGGRAR